jgi:hypothetical protein
MAKSITDLRNSIARLENVVVALKSVPAQDLAPEIDRVETAVSAIESLLTPLNSLPAAQEPVITVPSGSLTTSALAGTLTHGSPSYHPRYPDSQRHL